MLEANANVAQLVEHIHGKDEVTSSILVIGSDNSKYFLKEGSERFLPIAKSSGKNVCFFNVV